MSICAHLWRCWESQVCIKLLNKLWGVPCCQHSQKILAALWRFLMDLQVWISVLCSSTLLAFMQLRLQYFLYNQQIKSSLELQKAVGFKHSIYCYETVVVVIITFRILISYSTRYHCVMIVYLKILWHGIPPISLPVIWTNMLLFFCSQLFDLLIIVYKLDWGRSWWLISKCQIIL